MLSRVADAMYWMSRYLERAEHVARLLDVSFHTELDLHGVLSGPLKLQWNALLAILQVDVIPEPEESLQQAISRRLTFEMEIPTSIMMCVNRSRNNARSVRGSIASEMWRELNKLYWQLSDAEFRQQVLTSPHDLYQTVQVGSQLFQGICDATMSHDESWQFIQLGKYLERADKTLRILDVKSQLLSRLTSPTELPLANLQWGSVLMSCSAYESYRRLYISRVEHERVIEFLLMNPELPHSVRFCLERAADALVEISGKPLERNDSPAARRLGRIISGLRYRDIDDLIESGLHDVLATAMAGVSQLSSSIQQQYSLH